MKVITKLYSKKSVFSIWQYEFGLQSSQYGLKSVLNVVLTNLHLLAQKHYLFHLFIYSLFKNLQISDT